MFSQKVARFEVHIETTAQAAAKVDDLLRQAQPRLESEIRECRATADGGKFYVVVCNQRRDLDKLLFNIERVRGAVVHACTTP